VADYICLNAENGMDNAVNALTRSGCKTSVPGTDSVCKTEN